VQSQRELSLEMFQKSLPYWNLHRSIPGTG